MTKTQMVPALILLAGLAQAQVIPPAGKAPFRQLLTGQYSAVKQQKLVVLPNQAAFDRYFQQQLGQPARTAPTNIDWFQYKVVAVHLGERPTGGYRIQIQGLDESRNNQATLRAIEVTPTPGSFVTQAITSPWVLLLVDNQIQNVKLSLMKRDGTGTMLPGAPGGGQGSPACTCRCPYCCGG